MVRSEADLGGALEMKLNKKHPIGYRVVSLVFLGFAGVLVRFCVFGFN